MVEINTDARENTKEESQNPYVALTEQNEQIIQLLDAVFWALGGPMQVNIHRQQYHALLSQEKAAKQQADMKSKIVTAAAMPPHMDFPPKK